MAWKDVVATEKYQSLTPEDQSAAKQKYWDTVAAPKVKAAGKDVDTFKQAFFNETSDFGKPVTIKSSSEIPGGDQISASQTAWLQSAATPEKIAEYEAQGTIGMGEAFSKLNKWKMIPFLSGKATYDTIQVFNSMQKVQKGETITDEENAELQEFVEDMIEVEARGYSIGGGIVNAALQMPAFAVEFMATGGALTAGRKALTKGASELVEKGVKKSIGQRIAAGTVEKVGMATGRTVLMPHRVADSYYGRKINDSIEFTDKGELMFKEASEKPGITAMKAFGDVLIENLSEDLGGVLITPVLNKVGAGVSRVSRPVKRLLPETLRQGFAELTKQTTNLGVKESIEKLGYNGLLEEIGEERIADLLRVTFNVDTEAGYSADQFINAAFPDADQLLIEVGAIAMFGGMSRSAQFVGNKLLDRGMNKTQVEETLRSMSQTELDDMAVQMDQRETQEQVEAYQAETARIQEQVIAAGRTQEEAQAFTDLIDARVVAIADSLQIPREQIIKRWGLEVQKGQLGMVEEIGVPYEQRVPQDTMLFQSADAYDKDGDVKTESPEFKAWFGDSKVVDENGKPLVVYHGTDAKFDEFTEESIGSSSGQAFLGSGFYFSTSESVAKQYGKNVGGFYLKSDNVVDLTSFTSNQINDIFGDLTVKSTGKKYNELYQQRKNIENSITKVGYDDLGNGKVELWYEKDGDFEFIRATVWKNQLDDIKDIDNFIKSKAVSKELNKQDIKDVENIGVIGNIFYPEDIKDAVTRAGYDGIKSYGTNITDTGFEYVVFSPEQIKSVDNTGAFSPETANIFYQSKLDDKVEDGYIRLYRGLEQEFDKDYDLSSSDAPSGYSTWTDNPELAAQYAGSDGFVYYMDLPIKEQGSDLIDEDGERPLFIDNEKAAGLNDISGKEYLVYTDHDLYNSNDIKQSKDKTYFQTKSLDGLDQDDIAEIQGFLLQAALNKNTTLDKLKFETVDELIEMFKPKRIAEPQSLADKLKARGFAKDNMVLKDFALTMGYDPKVGRGHILRPSGKIQDETDLKEFLMMEGYATNAQIESPQQIEQLLERADTTYTEEDQAKIDAKEQMQQNYDLANELIRNYSVEQLNQVKDMAIEQEKRKGAIEFDMQGKAVISLFDSADTSTLFHELGHLFLEDLRFYADSTDNKAIKQQLKSFEKWLGNDGGELTIEQHEQFARGFEQYLRTGKAPVARLQELFNKFKDWLQSIYTSAKQLNVTISKEAEAAFDYMFMTQQERKERRREIDTIYDQNYELKKEIENQSIFGSVKNKSIAKKNSIREYYEKAFIPIETRAADISPELFRMFRKYTYDLFKMNATDNKAIKPFIEKATKMDEKDFATLDLALKNRDNEKADEIISKYDMEADFANVRETLDDIYRQAEDAGIDLGYLDSYYPRMFKSQDSDKLLTLLEARANKEEIDIKDLKLRPQDAKYSKIKKLLEQHPEWTVEQKAQFVNNNIRGFGDGQLLLSRIGSLKYERAIEEIDAEMNQFYMPFTESLAAYVSGARENIANKKFFGSERQEVKDVRASIKRTQTDIQNLTERRTELLSIRGDAARKEQDSINKKLEKRYDRLKELNQVLDAIKDATLEQSIGGLVSDMVSTGTIYAKDEKLVRDLLKAKFDQKGIGSFYGAVRDTGYILTLNDFVNTVTQFGDLSLAAYRNGLFNSIAGISKPEKITKEDLGIDNILQEFGTENSPLTKFLTKQFKYIGFNAIDSLGKNTIINGSIVKYQNMAEKNPDKLDKELDKWFVDAKDKAQVKQDLLNKVDTDDVVFLAFNDLASLQPISPDQLPEAYSYGGVYRLFYALKTYTLKLLDIVRNDIFKEMATNPKNALRNLVMLQAMMILFGVPKDMLKNLLTGEEDTFGEHLVNNIFLFQILNKYSLTKLSGSTQDNNPIQFAASLFAPPAVEITSSLYVDAAAIAKGEKDLKDAYSARYIPFIGEGYYQWVGKGAERKSEKELSIYD